MHELTINNAIAPAGDLTADLFNNFIEYVDRCEKTTKTYIINLRQFAAFLAFRAITKPQRADIIAYRDYLATEHDAIQLDPVNGWTYRTDKNGKRFTVKCSANTVAQYLRSVCQFFKWTASSGFYPNIADNIHAPKVRQDTHKKEALAPADVAKVENNIDRTTEQGKRLFAMYVLAVNCGLRTIELSRANVKDLQTKNGVTTLLIWGKGHAEADTKKTITPEVKAAIDDYLQARTDAYNGNSPLFVATGNRSGGKRIAPDTISKHLKAALRAAGYDSDALTAHSLRHTAGTNAMELTGNIYLTQKYMRHASPATTEIYLHNDTDQHESSIAQQLYNLYHGKDTGAELERLQIIIKSMTPEQLQQLTGIAAAIVK